MMTITSRLNTGLTVIAAVVLILSACSDGTQPPPRQSASPETATGVIVAMGDSLTEGYGLDESQAYPALLEDRLQAAGYDWKVINAGISGETSSGALSRIDWVLTLEPDIVILETGANDGMRGIDPSVTRANIDAIVKRLNAEGVTVVLAGMKMFRNLGLLFVKEFESIYPDIAKANDLILIPFFLDGVAAKPALNQSDGIHPTSEGYDKVAETVLPFVVQAITDRG